MLTLRASPIHHLAIGLRARQAFMMKPGSQLGSAKNAWKRFQDRQAFVIVGKHSSPRHGDLVYSGLKKPTWDCEEPFPGKFEGYAVKAPYGWTLVKEPPHGVVLVEGTYAEWKAKHKKKPVEKPKNSIFDGLSQTPPAWTQQEDNKRPRLQLLIRQDIS